MDVSHLKTPDSEVIQLVWRASYEAEGVVFYPNSSWTQGRNRLFDEMRSRFPCVEFQYAVFLDDDAELEEVLDYGMNTGNAWRTFEKYLIEWEPAVGFPSYQYSPKLSDEVQTVFNFDQIVVAYHWESWPVLLPYTEVFDDQSWWYCATVQQVLCAAFYNSYRIQFNAVKAINPIHRGIEGVYKKGIAFQIPMGWIASGLTDMETIGILPFEYPLQRECWGTPQKRDREQGLGKYFINPTIDFVHFGAKSMNIRGLQYSLPYESQHPYFVDRYFLQPFGVMQTFGVYSGIQAVCTPSPLMRLLSKLFRNTLRISESLRIAVGQLRFEILSVVDP
jgi:hypothetical protein